MKKEPQLDKYFYITGWIIIGLILIYGIFIYPIPFLCLFNHFTGYYCPGCGGTRAFIYLIHGHVLKSVIYHPFVLFTTALGAWFMLTQTLYRIRKKSGYVMHMRMIYIYIAVAIVVVNCIVKNLLLYNGIWSMG